MIDYFEPAERFNLSHYLIDRHIESGKGDRIALVCPEGEWTYQQLYQQANRFAHLLIERGARPEERILIGIRDSVDFVAALLGTLKAGCVVVMISPDLKPEQVAEMICYSRARIAVVERGGVELFHQAFHLITDTTQRHLQLLIEMLGGERTHILEGEGEERAHPPAQERSVTEKADLPKICFQEHTLSLSSDHLTMTTHRDDPAIWLFSGGTTGRPKAIVQPHRSFVYTTERYGRGVMGYTEDDRTISIPKLYFGYATGANLFFPLSVGASSILFPDRPTPALRCE